MKIIVGIYKIISPSGKIYIGQSTNIEKRWNVYRKIQCKKQIKLFNSLKKYGSENHIFEIIEECIIEQLNEREVYWKQHYIDILSWNNVLFCEIYDNSTGSKSDETKQKISTSLIGIKRSDETKQKMSNSKKGKIPYMKGKTHSSESKLKIINNRVLPKMSNRHIQNISKANSKSINQIQNNVVINTFTSITNANIYLNKQGSCCINEALKGRQKTAFGFKWEFVK